MPRPRYQITQGDVSVVHQWIRNRFRTRGWPEDWPELTAWARFPLDNPTAKKLQPWCDRFLDAAQWQQVQAVIRAARRDRSQYRTVRLSRTAHRILHAIAQRKTLTLSAVIEQYLSEVAYASEATPAVQKTLPPSPHPMAALAPEAPHVPVAITDSPPQEAPGTLPPRVMRVALSLRGKQQQVCAWKEDSSRRDRAVRSQSVSPGDTAQRRLGVYADDSLADGRGTRDHH